LEHGELGVLCVTVRKWNEVQEGTDPVAAMGPVDLVALVVAEAEIPVAEEESH
jgi:hypothetical protein